jgi:hypothetical protein
MEQYDGPSGQIQEIT